jgi:anti-sigma-K factor RskA
MLPLDALGALDETAAHELRAHISGCSECRAELDEMREVAAMLAHTVAPVKPSAHLRARLIDQIKTSAATTTAAVAADAPPASHVLESRQTGKGSGDVVVSRPKGERSDGDSNVVSGTNVVSLEKERDRRYFLMNRAVFTAGAIAASLVIVALASALVAVWTNNKRTQGELASLSARVNRTEEELARERRMLARERESTELLSAPDARLTALAGTESAPAAHATIAYDRRTGRALLVASGLPPAPAGKAYQLWFIAGGRPLPGGVFTTDDAGRAMMRDQAPPEGLDTKIFAVTLEPAQGTSAPTGAKCLVGNVS